MKKILLLFCMPLCGVCVAFSQPDINGVYYDNDGRCIKIFERTFSMADEKAKCADDWRYSYAKATYVWENENIFRLQHVRPDSLVYETMKVRQSYDKSITDSICVYFSIPNLRIRNLDIGILCNMSEDEWSSDLKEYSLIYVGGYNKSFIMLPEQTKLIICRIVPEEMQMPSIDSITGFYNSYTTLKIHRIDIAHGINRIDIEIPNLDDGYFGRYYVNGDYVRVVGDKLYWRGRVFEKSYDPEDIRYIEEKESALKK